MIFLNIEDYVKTSLSLYGDSIFPDRFSVLAHMFSVRGNGIELSNDGYLKNEYDSVLGMNRHEIQAQYLNCYGGLQSLETRKNNGFNTFEMFKAKPRSMVECLHFEKRYNTEPVYINVGEWSTIEKYQPFKDFIGCRCDDFKPQMKYFIDTIEQFPIKSMTVENLSTFLGKKKTINRSALSWYNRDNNICIKDLKEWKSHTNELRELFKL